MPITNWDGKLTTNEVYSDLYNVTIRHIVFSNNIYDTKSSLLDMSKIDGGPYGSGINYTSFDIGNTYEWLGDREAANLLNVNRNETEITQRIETDSFRQINLTTDRYLTKRAWQDEAAFGQFNSALLQNIQDTKGVYDSNRFNVFIGTNETDIGKQLQTITLQKEEDGETPEQTEARNRIDAQTIAKFMSDLMVELEFPTRDYNDYEYMRSFNSDDLVAIWNSDWVNKITKVDTPTIYNRDSALADKFGEYTLPGFLFGTVKQSPGTTSATNLTIRANKEGDFGGKHLVYGELLPGECEYEAGEVYEVDPSKAFIIMHKESVPYLVGFTASTEFSNSRALNENHYLTWGFNSLEHLHQYPFIVVRAVPAA